MSFDMMILLYCQTLAETSDRQLVNIDLDDESNLLPLQDMFVGSKITSTLQEANRETRRTVGKAFYKSAQQGYIAAAMKLQDKLPIANKLLVKAKVGFQHQRLQFCGLDWWLI